MTSFIGKNTQEKNGRIVDPKALQLAVGSLVGLFSASIAAKAGAELKASVEHYEKAVEKNGPENFEGAHNPK
ncbi:MAG: hypothetical protein COY58_05825 [Gammaproteobacteria bacterium CG_4_10_14_0_8_um_filter_38_16]|nr:MAG: hypothetical protein COY58_05825 [Gammaproteobacteria bacterium CG_4_10_14_0_8_um_filter_38_16]PJA04407.1 MAG: hypothetical protein COX72_00435 [Gammaproteobacteria bacterium CG_4_10_14_0_2_um_filter_38_22]PJB10172.1 MAG: hypothetical protein CO120_06145 [Gammaproteobacteria bacterium CG_4_9_14_3_um_filter_38_9]